MKYGISLKSIIPMRKEPAEQSEMVSQLLFGECYGISEENKQWLRISGRHDRYSGWIDIKLHHEISENFLNQIQIHPPHVLNSLLGAVETRYRQRMLIVAGSNMPFYNKADQTFNIDGMVFHFHPFAELYRPDHVRDVAGTSQIFLNSPYLWGGRSPFGFDCSGFTQIVYKINGQVLNRDAAQQALQGVAVNSLAEALPGDLAFFSNKTGHIIHTGIVISPDEIIHCSGFVRRDKLDDQGIISSGEKKYSHSLCAIRRIQ
jgi:gamma-D-glutamyl-L-lysine dipeptidyl-peptidase